MIMLNEARAAWRYDTADSPLNDSDDEIRALRTKDPAAYVDALTERLFEEWWDILRRALASELLGSRRRLPAWAGASFPCRPPLAGRPLAEVAGALERRARVMLAALV
jgi:hypothetical protein